MNSKSAEVFKICKLLMKPAVRFALRSGVLLQQLIQVAKEAYIEVAEEELAKSTEKINVSRLSVMTGVHRQDVTKIFRDRDSLVEESPQSLLDKVIATWSHDRRYQNQSKQPRVLSCDSSTSEFNELVSRISTTVNPGTIVFELVRNGAAIKIPRGLKLIRSTVASGMYPDRTYGLLAKDIDSLTQVVEENLAAQNNPDIAGHAHYRTEYDNILIEKIPQIRRWVIERSRKFHREIRDYLSAYDADFLGGVGAEKGGARVVIGSFCHSASVHHAASVESSQLLPPGKLGKKKAG